MEMNEVFDKLKSLQDILAEKYSLEEKINDSPMHLGEQEEALARSKKEYIERNASYEQVKAEVASLKDELEQTVKAVEEAEEGIASKPTNHDTETLMKQRTEAMDKEASIRKDLQKKEKDMAEQNETLQELESLIKSQEEDVNQVKKSLDEEVSNYNGEMERLSKAEAEITPGLDPEIVIKFQRIIKRNKDGIVAVRRGICTGCHMILPAQFANKVHDGESIEFCPYCSRVLFYEEAEDEDTEIYDDSDETGSLADFNFDDDEDEFAEGESDSEMDEDTDSDDEKTVTFEE